MKEKEKCKVIFPMYAKTEREVYFRFQGLVLGSNVYQIGSELFNNARGEAGGIITNRGHKVFLDLRLNGTPEEVATVIKKFPHMHLKFLSLDLSGGPEMIRAAGQAIKHMSGEQPKLLGVTGLTGLYSEIPITIDASSEGQIIKLAETGIEAGLAGLVCSPLELPILREKFGPELIIAVLGVRPKRAEIEYKEIQTITPEEAVKAGASYIIISEVIKRDPRGSNPMDVEEQIQIDMEKAQGRRHY